jgi:hypothetical protein
MSSAAAPVWTDKRLEKDRKTAEAEFRRQRLEEPLSAYLEFFQTYQGVFENLLEETVDFKDLKPLGKELLKSPEYLEALRYVIGPPISEDDLKIVADARLSPSSLENDPAMVARIIEVLELGIDRERFPWFVEERAPTEAERHTAIVASATLLAAQRVATLRRTEQKNQQEQDVENELVRIGFTKVMTRNVTNITQAPGKGEFCRESKLGTRKADFLVGLYDGRCMPVECKVSNSATNSVKRLINDAGAKCAKWLKDFGESNVVPTALLSGVYKLHNLGQAQELGLTLFWAHDLKTFSKFVRSTKK